ncbi:MAG TPA: DUF2181 domain-containing protein [Ktedonosporobacter sp.]|nr:DUF2181 domain-containing protein [Ktedonosporobacter sp.]
MRELVSYLQAHYSVHTLGEITWSHAVNSREKLQRFLQHPGTMMIETDIRLSRHGQIIAAHPPAIDSDLSFSDLLQEIAGTTKAIKLDFKDPEILIPSLTQLREAGLHQPVMLNADILQGNRTGPPKFNAAGFLALCKMLYPQGLLSPGWTTRSGLEASYTDANIDEMLELCRDIPQLTFPVRASLLPTSWKVLTRLIEPEGYSLTIWNAEPIDKDLQAWIHDNTDPTRTFYDFVDEKKEPVQFW